MPNASLHYTFGMRYEKSPTWNINLKRTLIESPAMRMIEIRELRELDLSAHHHHLTLVLSIDNTSMLLLHVSQYWFPSFKYSWFIELLFILQLHLKTWISMKLYDLRIRLIFSHFYINQLFSAVTSSTKTLILYDIHILLKLKKFSLLAWLPNCPKIINLCP